MCGIIGFSGSIQKAKLIKSLSTISHRGYDDQVTTYNSGWNLGMVRLAINDLSKGHYPMKYKQFQLIFNGEIYNYPQLKSTLVKAGFSFKTTCDAEVILPLFDLLGTKTFSLLEGMFAIAIVNTQTGELILARDKSGEKPLYYANEKSFIFSSELKAIISVHPRNVLNQNALGAYLHNGAVYGNTTLISGVYRVQAAHYLKYNPKDKSCVTKPYWSISYSPSQLSNEKLKEKFENLLQKSLKARLLSDVPIGTFLSGGVDSSLITALASKHISNLHTFSVSFPESTGSNESKYAKIVSNHLGTKHTEVICTSQSLRPIIEKAGKIVDEPIVDPAILPTFLMTQAARKKVKVALTGEGADELFGGYYRYNKYLLAKSLQQLIPFISLLKNSKSLIPKRFQRGLEDISMSYSPQNVWTEQELSLLLQIQTDIPGAVNQDNCKLFSHHPLMGLKVTDFTGYLSEQLLMKVDKIAMQNNLEARAPFLDSNIISLALSLSKDQTFSGNHNKIMLRKIAEKYLPSEIVWREKHGFDVPLNDWFRNEYKDLLSESIHFLISEHNHIFSQKTLKIILEEHLNHVSDHSNKLWSLLVLAQWIDTYDISAQ